MGFRTTVIFNNDHLESLKNDPEIGQKIYHAILGYGFSHDGNVHSNGCTVCSVIEQAHADVVRLGVIGKGGSFSFTEVYSGTYNTHDLELNMLKHFADKLGYKVLKKKE